MTTVTMILRDSVPAGLPSSDGAVSSTRPRKARPQVSGVDYMARALADLFPGRPYASLAREQCGAVRRRVIELLEAAGHVLPERVYAERRAGGSG